MLLGSNMNLSRKLFSAITLQATPNFVCLGNYTLAPAISSSLKEVSGLTSSMIYRLISR